MGAEVGADVGVGVGQQGAGRVLSAHQASVLDHLDSVAATSVGKLASHMGVTPSTMSLTLDRLEAGGYVRRRRDAADTRRVGVLLTDAGERIRRANSVLDPDLVDALLETLAPADRARAVDGLAVLADAAGRMSHDARRIDLRPDAAGPTHAEQITAGDRAGPASNQGGAS